MPAETCPEAEPPTAFFGHELSTNGCKAKTTPCKVQSAAKTEAQSVTGLTELEVLASLLRRTAQKEDASEHKGLL